MSASPFTITPIPPGGRAVFTVQLGVRWLGGYVGEVYLAPKGSYFEPMCQT
ncbi:MAG TPA: hypothetical protein VNO30_27930 [Kofleriaceae bacterium]|nr:hypothetical protein [Kofleriaceae bacterium]